MHYEEALLLMNIITLFQILHSSIMALEEKGLTAINRRDTEDT